MNVCIDARPLQNAHRTRGVGVLLGKLLSAMGAAVKDHDVSLVCQNGEVLPELFRRQTQINTRRLNRPNRFNWMADHLFLAGLVRQSGADVFLATDFNSYLAPPRGVKVVSMAYDMIPFVFPDAMSQQPFSVQMGWRINFAKLRESLAVIAISEATKSDIVRIAGIVPEKIHVIYPGIDQTLFCRDRSESVMSRSERLARCGVRDGFLLYVGDSEPRKNLQRVLQAFSMTPPPLDLLIVGKKAPDDRQLHSWAAQAGVSDRVRFAGYVPEEELPALYGAASAFVFPTLYEGFGLPVLEAMACGCPVITSDISSLPEVAGDAALLVDPENTSQIAEAIKSVLQKDVRNRLRLRGFSQASRFSWERSAAEVWRVLESVS